MRIFPLMCISIIISINKKENILKAINKLQERVINVIKIVAKSVIKDDKIENFYSVN